MVAARGASKREIELYSLAPLSVQNDMGQARKQGAAKQSTTANAAAGNEPPRSPPAAAPHTTNGAVSQVMQRRKPHQEAKARAGLREALAAAGERRQALMQSGLPMRYRSGRSATSPAGEEWRHPGNDRWPGYPLHELRAHGYNPVQLRFVGHNARDLRSAGFPIVELKAAGFNAVELKAAKYRASELRAIGFQAKECVQNRLHAQLLPVPATMHPRVPYL